MSIENQIAVNADDKEEYCPECESTMTYVRIKKQELVCRNCGHIAKLEDKKEDEEIAQDSV